MMGGGGAGVEGEGEAGVGGAFAAVLCIPPCHSDLQWTDSTGSLERFMDLKPYQVGVTAGGGEGVCGERCGEYMLCVCVVLSALSAQRINHFPGMGGIARKDSLARNIQK